MSTKTENLGSAGDYESVQLEVSALRADMQGGVSMGGPVDSLLVAWAPEGESACTSVKCALLGDPHDTMHLLAGALAQLLLRYGPEGAQSILYAAMAQAVQGVEGDPNLPGDEWKHG